jgi:predicted DNA binding protein
VLTERQREILKFAHTNGYYERPKKISIKDLAQRFKVSTATAGEIIQRGEKRIMNLFFYDQ